MKQEELLDYYVKKMREMPNNESYTQFFESIKSDDVAYKTFLHYANTWNLEEYSISDRRYISEDGSSGYYHDAPCVFLGTNHWAMKRFCDQKTVVNRALSCANRLIKQAAGLGAPAVAVIIPEKDFLIDHILGATDTHSNWKNACEALSEKFQGTDIVFIDFYKTLESLSNYRVLSEYFYPDTHLLTKDYISISSIILNSIDIGIPLKDFSLELNAEKTFFFDLSAKLGLKNTDFKYEIPNASAYDIIRRTAGHENFADPLGDTYQCFDNDAPLYNKKVTLFGDSHCSISGKGKMTDVFSLQFAQSEFYWNPWAVRTDIKANGSDLYVFEISQRFLT